MNSLRSLLALPIIDPTHNGVLWRRHVGGVELGIVRWGSDEDGNATRIDSYTASEFSE